jgi:hypothetical protein
VESVLSVFNDEFFLSWLIGWWHDAAQVSWSQEFGCDGNADDLTNWVSSMVELGTKDMHFSSTGNWASQWRHLRESWWVEEDEFQALSDILVVQSKLKHNAHQWWIEVVWWTLASGFS